MQLIPHSHLKGFPISARPNSAKIQFDGSLSPSFFRALQSSTLSSDRNGHIDVLSRPSFSSSVGGANYGGQFVNAAFDGNENSVVVIDADDGMENGNVIFKSGSVTAANGRVERSSSGSPSVVGGGSEDGGGKVIFGLREDESVCANWW